MDAIAMIWSRKRWNFSNIPRSFIKRQLASGWSFLNGSDTSLCEKCSENMSNSVPHIRTPKKKRRFRWDSESIAKNYKLLAGKLGRLVHGYTSINIHFLLLLIAMPKMFPLRDNFMGLAQQSEETDRREFVCGVSIQSIIISTSSQYD